MTDESDPSQEELIHEHLCREVDNQLVVIESEIQLLRLECESLYVKTGNERTKFLAAELKKLEIENGPGI